MEYFLNEQQLMVKNLAKKIAQEKMLPVRAELDEKGIFPTDIIKEFAKADLMRLYIPTEYDGLGYGVLDLCLVIEELAKVDGGVAVSYAVNALGSFPILIMGSEEQKKRWLPKAASGEYLTAFALTEANAGSDASNIETMAVLDGDHYILNGTKQFITNGRVADITTVIAQTDKSKGNRGLVALVVEKGTPGFGYGKDENKMGIRSSVTTELVFQDCKVPVANMLGKEGQGIHAALRTLDKSRPGIAAQGLGIAWGAYEAALKYSKERVQFGKPIFDNQAIAFMLADMAKDIEAGRALVYSAARMIDGGMTKYSKEAAMAKCYCTDLAMRVTTDAVQIFGGYGYMKEYPVEKMMRDAKITQIYEGTNQIQRLVIAANIVKDVL
ncbi:MAG TPA: acyl-CoA dehydrogenase family protein [Caldisericia bacterium]|nr:acyl-CoA dehydrogenase family protein [Caldisericia bacterium]HPF49568.1 acyl-CoA dehydrogenase family protein [Caldisericia bacterium]HPI84516.1 acyl-CoA dehydrogenase family protein [Caldisericia bacterium]HPQ93882.1 acyl-CoA dehydrogenase family protein [Caldisericia bacterium]HRV75427.1 acyl-CoA dehydrogenase family protein [Caldisericia bacterium]